MTLSISFFIITISLDILLFFYFSGTNLTYKRFGTAIFIYLLSYILETLVSLFISPFIHYNIFHMLAFCAISYVFRRKDGIRLVCLYALFPVVFEDLLRKFLNFSIAFASGLTINNFQSTDNSIIYTSLLSPLLVYLFYRFMHYQLKDIRLLAFKKSSQTYVLVMDILLIIYYLSNILSFFVDDFFKVDTVSFRYSLVAIYIVIFMASMNRFDRAIKQSLQDELEKQKDAQLKNMADYSHHIEELYKEVRTFRHDYANILSVLHDGIERRDIAMIEETYYRVLDQTGKNFHDPKYDIGRLVNVQDDAIKSMISAKLLEAQSKGIAISVEVPSPTKLDLLDILDMLTLLSILLDNAIEGTLGAEHPSITLALIENDKEQVIVIENTTKEERINTRTIFQEGVSSKGDKRGLGLATIALLRQKYPNMSIHTKSAEYLFRQILRILPPQTPKS